MESTGSLEYRVGANTYTFGTMTGYGETYSKSVSAVPIVTLSYKDTFAVESSSQLNYTIKFTRVQPYVINDDSGDCADWSNMHWFDEMTKLVDRWQAKTDGGLLVFTPSVDNPYIPAFTYNGYIKSLVKHYSEGRNTELECTLEFHVGTMYVNNEKQIPKLNSIQPLDKSLFSIIMSDASITSWYPLLGTIRVSETETLDVDCVKSYKLYGGVEEPFEHLSMTIPKDRLNSIAPDLSSANNMIAGRNKIILNAMGSASMYLARASSEGDNLVLEAYCDATVLRSKKLQITYTDYPFGWIKRILCEGKYGVFFKISTSPEERGSFVYSCVERNSDTDYITFEEGTNIWLILQICAMYLGCKIFFAHGNAYLIDYRRDRGDVSRTVSLNPVPVKNTNEVIDLYTSDETDPLFGRVIDQPSLGNEGVDTIVNTQTIKCQGYDEDGRFGMVPYTGSHLGSVDTFGTYEGDIIYVPGITQGADKSGTSYNQGEIFVNSYLDYRAEPQQSIQFTLKELYKDHDTGEIRWAPFFDPTAAVGSIISKVNKIVITNVSTLPVEGNAPRVPQKLILSQFVRKYPEGQTTYFFGQMSSVDLSSNASQVSHNLNNL